MAWLGVPNQIKTDNGPNFVSKSAQTFASKWGITLIHGIPYNSTGQAIVERANQTLKSKLEDRIVGRPHNPYAPVTRGDSESTSTLPTPGSSTLSEILVRWEDQKILQKIVTSGPPSFQVKLCDLAPVDPCSHDASYYMCPNSNPGRSYCNVPNQYYCSYWGCETIASDWTPGAGPDKYLKVQRGPYGCVSPPKDPLRPGFAATHGDLKNWCLYLTLNVTNENDLGWTIGKTWGLRYWESGTDRGTLFFIKKQEIKNSAEKEILANPTPVLTSTLPIRQIVPLNRPHTNSQYLPNKPFFDVLDATFWSLNQSNPNLTNSCWLCYDVHPPFYEGVALNVSFNYSSDSSPAQCKWDTPRKGITLSQIRGQGICFGNTTLANQNNAICTETVMVNKTYKWAIPSASGIWVCHKSGVTPCVSLELFDGSKDFCVQILIVPRVLYHPEEEMYYHWGETNNKRQKREVLTAVTIATLLGLGIAGTSTVVTSLITQQRGLSQLQTAIDEDLQKIEKSMTFLEQSLSSLSEVVLQNRRGLDLLFMQQGGLCAALKEECCFYADHTGVVRDTMVELRERLAQRKKDRETQQGWFESWFNPSPWLTTLISTLAGPIIILMIVLIFGPCILNRLVLFVKSQLEKINIMLVEHQQLL
uniref:Integrase catalytic domain-containing protein n=1 Tax=Strix occidentalis caurina TaxID=311401 RepID=A0A8D0EYG2_STROC